MTTTTRRPTSTQKGDDRRTLLSVAVEVVALLGASALALSLIGGGAPTPTAGSDAALSVAQPTLTADPAD